MATGTFFKKMDELKEQVGKGVLEGKVSVDQVYAHYQDSGVGPRGKPAAAFEHPRGGMAAYLSSWVVTDKDKYLQALADSIGEHTPMDDVMVKNMLDLATKVRRDAPREYWILRNSAHPEVRSGGKVIFDQPPVIGRLSQTELNAIRAAGGGDIIHDGEFQHETSYKGHDAALFSRALRLQLPRVLRRLRGI